MSKFFFSNRYCSRTREGNRTELVCSKNFKTRGPEARLYSACFAGVLFPIGMFLYAWTSFEKVNWIGMAIGITVSVYPLPYTSVSPSRYSKLTNVINSYSFGRFL